MAHNGLVRTLQRELDKKMSKGVKEIEKEVMTLLNLQRNGNENINENNEKESINGNGNSNNNNNDNDNNNNKNKNEKNDKNVKSEENERKYNNGEPSRPILREPDAPAPISFPPISEEISKIISEMLTLFTTTQGNYVSLMWKELLPQLITTYRDGMIITDTDTAIFGITKMFYPKWWLESVGYFNKKGNPKGILFLPNPLYSSKNYFSWNFWTGSNSENSDDQNNNNDSFFTVVITVLLSGIIFYFFGYFMGRNSLLQSDRNGYTQIRETKSNRIENENLTNRNYPQLDGCRINI